ncbi:hypothetical protein LMTR13_33745 [Bradyrhizobium icense]|uniref:Uncharacterized protein n=1 Tax=Bradyrhizobium icense TaxID=1274631 RepID=A0A1B1UNK3_9BRAD|nr:hypothetical protein LMTR13_33745 [Bradyrhizobium icense]
MIVEKMYSSVAELIFRNVSAQLHPKDASSPSTRRWVGIGCGVVSEETEVRARARDFIDELIRDELTRCWHVCVAGEVGRLAMKEPQGLRVTATAGGRGR